MIATISRLPKISLQSKIFAVASKLSCSTPASTLITFLCGEGFYFRVAKMLRLKSMVAACVLALTVGAANANTLIEFDASGTFASGQSLTLGGFIIVDVTAG